MIDNSICVSMRSKTGRVLRQMFSAQLCALSFDEAKYREPNFAYVFHVAGKGAVPIGNSDVLRGKFYSSFS